MPRLILVEREHRFRKILKSIHLQPEWVFMMGQNMHIPQVPRVLERHHLGKVFFEKPDRAITAPDLLYSKVGLDIAQFQNQFPDSQQKARRLNTQALMPSLFIWFVGR